MRAIADSLWGLVDGKTIKGWARRAVGKCGILDGVTLEEVFSGLGLEPDLRVEDDP